MNAKEAIQARWRLAWLRGTVFSVLFLIIALLSLSISIGGTIVMILAITGVSSAMIYAFCLLLVLFWKRDLDERYLGLPEAGVLVCVDRSGLRIGEIAAPWQDLSLQALHLIKDDGDVVLDRLTLSGIFDGVTLDPELIENGDDIVAYVFHRVCLEPARKPS